MYKILVAGAGHGGLSAAINLAEKGFDVTVYECRKRENLGHDWRDSMRRKTFDFVGIPRPEENLESCYRMSYMNPKKTVKIVQPDNPSDNIRYVERKFILEYLVSCAEERGVKFVFEADVVSAVCEAGRVAGLKIEKDGMTETVSGDVVIDAAGLNSPVRKSLPSRFGIDNEITPENKFTVYRAYYERSADGFSEPPYCVFFYNCGRCGMDWMITEDGYMDVLVGSFGDSLSQDEINASVKELKRVYPYMGDKIVRGGTVQQIPVCQTLKKMVCGGYAAVGDSACMTEPLSGSGIDLSMQAGKLLADVIIEADGCFTTEKLWKYQYTYYKNFAERNYNSLVIKNLMSGLTGADIDYLMEKKVITAKEICGKSEDKQGTVDMLMKGVNVIARPQIYKPLINALRQIILTNRCKKLMPEKYTEDGFTAWSRVYGRL